MPSYNELKSQINSTIDLNKKIISESTDQADIDQAKSNIVTLYNQNDILEQKYSRAQAIDPVNVNGDTDLSLYKSSNSTTSIPTVQDPVTNTTQSVTLPSTNATTVATQNSNGSENITVTASRTKKMKSQTDRRLKLRPKIGVNAFISNSILLKPLATTNGLIFPADARIAVNHVASYGQQLTTHMNQDFRYYTNTPALEFSISGTFTAQNNIEATYMLGAFHFLSVLTKMHTGQNSDTDPSIGLPPPVLLLSGFGPYNFNDLPVILTSGNYSYDPSVDLVTINVNGVDNDVPSICTITVNVTVQNTPEKLRTFNWDSFANGTLLANGGWK